MQSIQNDFSDFVKTDLLSFHNYRVDELFQPGFVVERLERGTTTVGDNTWPSAWYWLRHIG